MDTGLRMQVNNTDTDDIPRHLVEEGVTHIITKRKEKDKNLCKRTLKYLWGILAGVWIVDVSCKSSYYPKKGILLFLLILYIIGLEDCIRQKRWISEENYEIAGDVATGFTFAPRKGRLKRANIKSVKKEFWV